MSVLLPSALEKFNWAQDHFDRLRHEVDAFFDPKPYRIRTETNAAAQRVLDHCVYAIGVKETGDPPSEYSITEDTTKWNGAKWRLKTLSAPAQAAVEGLQPHKDSEEFALRNLGAVEQFDNTDKHRTIRVVASVPVLNRSGVSGPRLKRLACSPHNPRHSFGRSQPSIRHILIASNLLIRFGLGRSVHSAAGPSNSTDCCGYPATG